ncbi:MAG: OadG family transporter subunit [Halieaceae bacterium]
MEATLIDQGVELMLFGMGTVITFLTLLVIVTSVMSALLRRFAPEPVADETTGSAAATDSTLLAVIAAAIHKHRSRR